jgi:Ubiquitin-binding domain/Ubiquitin family
MGAGCVCQNSSSSSLVRVRTIRLGNLNFMVYGKINIDHKTVGKGCKRTPAWETLATKAEVEKKIQEFWETRTEGNHEAWNVLRTACQEPLHTNAEQIIKSSGLSMLSGSLMLTFDEVGHRYDLPVYVISEACRYGTEKILPKLPDNYKGEDYTLTIRCVKFPDVQITVNSSQNVKFLKETFANNTSCDPLKVRLFFNGKELKDDFFLHHCAIKDNIVVQAHIR